MILRVTIRLGFPSGSQHGTNTWHISTDVADPHAGLLAWGPKIQSYYNAIASALWVPAMTADFDGSAIQVDSSTPANVAPVPAWHTALSTTHTGVSGGVGLVVGWRSTLATRRGRGRTFHTPIALDCFQDDGTIIQSNLTAVRAAATQYIADGASSTSWAPVIWSETDKQSRLISSARVNDKVAWLSSRRG